MPFAVMLAGLPVLVTLTGLSGAITISMVPDTNPPDCMITVFVPDTVFDLRVMVAVPFEALAGFIPKSSAERLFKLLKVTEFTAVFTL